MAKTWSAFLPYVMEDVKECPKQYVENAIRDTAIDFCERSFLWYMRSNASDLLVGQPLYGFQTPTGTKAVRINKIEIYSVPLTLSGMSEIIPVVYDEFIKKYPNWNTDTGRIPEAYWALEPGLIRVYPIPSEDILGSLFAEVALAPTRSATQCPDFIFENYADVIGYGAKSRLLSSITKPWSNAEAGLFYEQKYRAGITKAESRTRKSKTNNTLEVQPQPFGHVRYTKSRGLI